MDAAVARYWQRGGEAEWREHVAVGAVHGAELAVVRERPDATLKEIQAALRKEGIHTSKSALDRFPARHKITRKKKSLLVAEQKCKDVACVN
jgi:hypothetical protein